MRVRIAVLCAALASAAAGVAQAETPTYGQPLALASATSAWPRLLGVVADPWHSDEWDQVIGNRVDVQMLFRAFSRQEDLTPIFEESTRRGLVPMLTWEPWQPAHGINPGELQPEYSNAAIASGAQDDYIRSVARVVAAHPGPVLIRYAHEMNGYWYPWHNDPAAYVAAWRHVVSIFRADGATNAVWIWSVAPDPVLSSKRWLAGLPAYWPGSAWVDAVGMTAIRSGTKPFTVAQFGRRLERLRSYGKPVWITEAGAALDQGAFAADLASYVEANPWIRGVVWSQAMAIAEQGSETAQALGDLAAAFAAGH
jgi:mannan endo-1,4-beta-mannosidase